jgi:tetratricopeptide (TPR) repeat protein
MGASVGPGLGYTNRSSATYEELSGYSAGIFCDRDWGAFGFRPEILYSQKTKKVNGVHCQYYNRYKTYVQGHYDAYWNWVSGYYIGGYEEHEEYVTYSASYLEIPLLVRAVARTRAFRPFVFAGPRILVPLGRSQIGDQYGTSGDYSRSFDSGHWIGATAGAGFDLCFRHNKVSLALSYETDLENNTPDNGLVKFSASWAYSLWDTAPAAARQPKKGRKRRQADELNALRETYRDELISAAKDFYRQGKLEEAKGKCRAVLKIDPYDSDACQYLGLCLWKTGEKDLALEYLEKAVRYDGTKTDLKEWLDQE